MLWHATYEMSKESFPQRRKGAKKSNLSFLCAFAPLREIKRSGKFLRVWRKAVRMSPALTKNWLFHPSSVASHALISTELGVGVSFICAIPASRQLGIACGQFSRQFVAPFRIPFGNLSEKRAVRSLAKTFIAPVNRSYVEQKKAQDKERR